MSFLRSLRSTNYRVARDLGNLSSFKSPSAAARRYLRRRTLAKTNGLLRRWLG